MDAPRDMVAIGYDLYGFTDLAEMLEAMGCAYIVQPKLKRVLTSQAAQLRVVALLKWREENYR